MEIPRGKNPIVFALPGYLIGVHPHLCWGVAVGAEIAHMGGLQLLAIISSREEVDGLLAPQWLVPSPSESPDCFLKPRPRFSVCKSRPRRLGLAHRFQTLFYIIYQVIP